MVNAIKVTLSTGRARENFGHLVNRVAFGKERLVLTRRGQALVAVVPVEDIALLEAYQDDCDVRDARRRLKEWRRSGRPTVTLEEVVRRCGIDLAVPPS
jgi:prevent-host-death family protein